MAALVGKGDATSTGGIVLSGTSTTYDNGRAMSLHGDVATCGNCAGTHRIFGTVDTWLDKGVRMVKHRDRVQCPCGKNYVLASADASIFIEDGNSSSSFTDVVNNRPATPLPHDEQFTLRCHSSGQPLENVPYRIKTGSGQAFNGVTDAHGRTQRITTEGAQSLRVEIAHNSKG